MLVDSSRLHSESGAFGLSLKCLAFVLSVLACVSIIRPGLFSRTSETAARSCFVCVLRICASMLGPFVFDLLFVTQPVISPRGQTRWPGVRGGMPRIHTRALCTNALLVCLALGLFDSFWSWKLGPGERHGFCAGMIPHRDDWLSMSLVFGHACARMYVVILSSSALV